jgi:predicted small metal-binding protein
VVADVRDENGDFFMKQFSCGDVVPGCTASFTGETEAEVLQAVGAHASSGHGIKEISPELLAAVRAHIREAPAA